ncbi:uncharacterized mitochondrial protein AtMg00810-like [Gossypium arboreum]|uniref:uncharacterized mitochondrial protein AtMg00810-like n=1 Tax=Gossypium arboreum TaxID=29729 RepID=UPI0022F18D8E|nr:uncharacterized mitochondrial protein AtMg00810-like [Gossypium arboreum]
MVYRLKKAFYLVSLGFNKSVSEPTLYVKKNQAEIQLIVSLYVDDLLVTGGDQDMLAEFKAKMKDMFEMSNLGLMTYFLGMEVLSKFSMENCKPTSTPIAVGMKLSSQGDHEPVNESIYMSLTFKQRKKVLRYIKGTLDYGVLFNKAESLKLRGYTDSDWASSSDDMKSTSGYAFTLGSTMFCWSSRK